MKTSTQLKALIRNVSKDKGINAEILLRNFMLERLLERISLSEYKNQFILNRGTFENIKNYSSEYIQSIESSEVLLNLWERYRANNEYASNINWEDTVSSMKRIVSKINLL